MKPGSRVEVIEVPARVVYLVPAHRLEAVIATLVKVYAPFRVEPLPDDLWAVTVEGLHAPFLRGMHLQVWQVGT